MSKPIDTSNVTNFPKRGSFDPDHSDASASSSGGGKDGGTSPDGTGSAGKGSTSPGAIGTPSIDDILSRIAQPAVEVKASPAPDTGGGTTVNETPRTTFTAENVPLGPRPQNAAARIVFGAKPCNYIFTVGRPGSGKTTFQSHLLRYLMKRGDHRVEPDIEHAKTSMTYQNMVLQWEEQWARGQFPDASVVGRPAEFRYLVSPTRSGYPALPFGFLEISGEDFMVLSRPSERPPALLPSLDEFLNNPRANLAFLFVCQGENMAGDDLLFSRFLTYLKMNVKRSFLANTSAALILADPETCQRRLAKKLSLPDDGRPLDVDLFVEHFTPQTAALLAAWKDRATIATFSVGSIREEPGPNGKPIPRIVDPQFDDAKAVYEWLYERFTGRTLGPGFIAKTLAWLKELGGG